MNIGVIPLLWLIFKSIIKNSAENAIGFPQTPIDIKNVVGGTRLVTSNGYNIEFTKVKTNEKYKLIWAVSKCGKFFH